MPALWTCVNTGADLVEDEIQRLRAALGAANDSELADMLGVSRYAVAKWKERGVIPPKHRFVLEKGGVTGADAAGQHVVHEHLFSHADNHFWLRAALHFLPTEYPASLTGDRGRGLEFIITRLMGVAIDATVRDLKKPRCEREADYEALIETLETAYADRIARVLNDGAPG